MLGPSGLDGTGDLEEIVEQLNIRGEGQGRGRQNAYIEFHLELPRSSSKGRGGTNSIRSLSQQWPMRTNQFPCLSLCNNGQQQCTDSLVVLVSHQSLHLTRCLLKQLRMYEPESMKVWAVKDILTLITQSTGSTQSALARLPWHMRPYKPALFNWQRMAAHPEMDEGPEFG